MMIQLLFCVVGACAAGEASPENTVRSPACDRSAQDEGDDTEDEEAKREHEKRVAEAVADLKTALREKEARLRAAAIERWKTLDDGRVAKALRPAVADETPEIRDAAISALRWMKNETSLVELHRFFKRAKKLRKESEAFASLIRAIGQHADESSIQLLIDGLQGDPDKGVMRARVYSLGKIRSVESIEALFQLLKSIDKDKVQKYMQEIRVALMLLTGKDFGVAQEEWRGWWKKARKGFEVGETVPRLPKFELELWNRFWGNEQG